MEQRTRNALKLAFSLFLKILHEVNMTFTKLEARVESKFVQMESKVDRMNKTLRTHIYKSKQVQ